MLQKNFFVVAPRLPIEAGLGSAARREPERVPWWTQRREKNTQKEHRGPKGYRGLFLSRGSVESRGLRPFFSPLLSGSIRFFPIIPIIFINKTVKENDVSGAILYHAAPGGWQPAPGFFNCCPAPAPKHCLS